MKEGTASRLVWASWSLTVLLLVAGAALLYLNSAMLGAGSLYDLTTLFTAALGYSTTGAVIVARRPRERVGRLLAAAGLLAALAISAQEYAVRTLITAPGSLPLGREVAALAGAAVLLTPVVALLVLVFPTGAPPSPRWRPVAWLIFAGAGMLLAGVLFGRDRTVGGVFRNIELPKRSPLPVLGPNVAYVGLLVVLIGGPRRGVGDRALPAGRRTGAPAAQVAGLRCRGEPRHAGVVDD